MKHALFFLWFINSSIFASTDYIKLVDQISAGFSKELSKEKMYLFGSGGRMMNDVEEVFKSYHIVKKTTIDEARILFVNLTERYLSLINGNTKLRPFLHNYPFTINNLNFRIGFENESHQFQTDLASVAYCKRTGHIYYNAYDPKKEMLYTIYEEPYEDAVKIVKGHMIENGQSG